MLVAAVEARDDQAVTAEVAVQRLVVVDRAAVLGPQLDLVEMQVRGSEIPLGRIDQVRVECEAIEIPGIGTDTLRLRRTGRPVVRVPSPARAK